MARAFANEGRTVDQHDAFCIAAQLARADREGALGGFLKPDLSPAERAVARVEGWIWECRAIVRQCLAHDSDEVPSWPLICQFFDAPAEGVRGARSRDF